MFTLIVIVLCIGMATALVAANLIGSSANAKRLTQAYAATLKR